METLINYANNIAIKIMAIKLSVPVKKKCIHNICDFTIARKKNDSCELLLCKRRYSSGTDEMEAIAEIIQEYVVPICRTWRD